VQLQRNDPKQAGHMGWLDDSQKEVMGRLAEALFPKQSTPTNLYPPWDTKYVKDLCTSVKKSSLLQSDVEAEDEAFEEAGAPPPHTDHRQYLRRFQVSQKGKYRLEKEYGGATMTYHGSADIEKHVPNSAKVAMVMMHGARRNADYYFCNLKEIAEKQKYVAPSHALLIAPKFQKYFDKPEDSDVFWNCSGLSNCWPSAGDSDPGSGAIVSSFAMLDQLIELLSNQENFPMLEEILFLGHSAGGQTVLKYSTVTEVVANPHMKLRFAVANPSSYVYFDKNRWAYSCDHSGCSDPVYLEYDPDLGREGWVPQTRKSSKRNNSAYDYLGSMEGKKFICDEEISKVMAWSYGLGFDQVDMVPYIRQRANIAAAKMRFKERDVVFLVGQNDTCSDDLLPFCDKSCWSSRCSRTLMDMRCPGMLQGVNRNVRGKLYMKHLEKFYGLPTHSLVEVPNAGHNSLEVYFSDVAHKLLFAI